MFLRETRVEFRVVGELEEAPWELPDEGAVSRVPNFADHVVASECFNRIVASVLFEEGEIVDSQMFVFAPRAAFESFIYGLEPHVLTLWLHVGDFAVVKGAEFGVRSGLDIVLGVIGWLLCGCFEAGFGGSLDCTMENEPQ